MNNLRILLYMMLLSLAACHPEGTSVKQGLDKAAQLMAQDPDTASIILETIQSSQMNEAQLAEYNLLCTQLNEDKSIPHSSDKQIRQAASYYEKHGDEYQKSKVYYYLACVESDLEQKKEAEIHSNPPGSYPFQYGYDVYCVRDGLSQLSILLFPFLFSFFLKSNKYTNEKFRSKQIYEKNE